MKEKEKLPTTWFKTEQISTWIGESLVTEGKSVNEIEGGHGKLIIMHQCGNDKEALKEQIKRFLYGLDNGFDLFSIN